MISASLTLALGLLALGSRVVYAKCRQIADRIGLASVRASVMSVRSGSRRRWVLAAVYSLAFLVPVGITLAATDECAANLKAVGGPSVPAHRIAIQVNSNDPTAMKYAITNSLNAIKAYRDLNQTFAIEIVAYGAGVHMFRADTSPVKELLQMLRSTSPDVTFSVCGNTSMIMERNEGHPLEFVEGTQVVPYGVVRLVALQEAGFTYLRP